MRTFQVVDVLLTVLGLLCRNEEFMTGCQEGDRCDKDQRKEAQKQRALSGVLQSQVVSLDCDKFGPAFSWGSQSFPSSMLTKMGSWARRRWKPIWRPPSSLTCQQMSWMASQLWMHSKLKPQWEKGKFILKKNLFVGIGKLLEPSKPSR